MFQFPGSQVYYTEKSLLTSQHLSNLLSDSYCHFEIFLSLAEATKIDYKYLANPSSKAFY